MNKAILNLIIFYLFKQSFQLTEITHNIGCTDLKGCMCVLLPNGVPSVLQQEAEIQTYCKFSSICLENNRHTICIESNIFERVCLDKNNCQNIFEKKEDFVSGKYYLTAGEKTFANDEEILKIKVGSRCVPKDSKNGGCMCSFGRLETPFYIYNFGIFVRMYEECSQTANNVYNKKKVMRSWKCPDPKGCFCNLFSDPCRFNEFCITAGPFEYCSVVNYFGAEFSGNGVECKNERGCMCGKFKTKNSKFEGEFDLCSMGMTCSKVPNNPPKCIGPKYSDICHDDKFCFCSDHEVALTGKKCLYYNFQENSNEEIHPNILCNLESGCWCSNPSSPFFRGSCTKGETCHLPNIKADSLLLEYGITLLNGLTKGMSKKIGLKDWDFMRCKAVSGVREWKCENLKNCYCGVFSRNCVNGEYCILSNYKNYCLSEEELSQKKNELEKILI